jgi:hypothetical protein
MTNLAEAVSSIRAAEAGAFTGYRRRIRITPRPDFCAVEMEDDCHHFGVTIGHDHTLITSIQTSSPRYPWTTCPAAGEHLISRMRGVALAAAADVDDQRQHCTHVYDLFVLAAHHAHDKQPMQYDIRVTDPVDGMMLAELDRNGETILRWRVGDPSQRDRIPGGDFKALSAWSKTPPSELQEAARMLRRGVLVSGGRHFDLAAGTLASAFNPQAVCYTFQPQRAVNAIRMSNSLRDFSVNPDSLLSGEDHDEGSRGETNP